MADALKLVAGTAETPPGGVLIWRKSDGAVAAAQNPLACPSCGGWPVGLCPCWDAAAKAGAGYPWGMWSGYKYQDEHVPTQRIPEPPPIQKCECGSGNHTRSGAHSHWCPLWVRS